MLAGKQKQTLGRGKYHAGQYKYKYNGKELQDELGLNMYDMDMRQYDPAIGRFTAIDPVTHFQQSTYTAFDNNPVYWSDPSGTTSVQDLISQAIPGITYNTNGDGTFSGNGHTIGKKRDPQEGESKVVDIGQFWVTKFYHNGGVNGSEKGWYSKEDYLENYRGIIRKIGQGQASISILNSFNFTEDVLIAMYAWAAEAYVQYGGKPRKANGNIQSMEFSSPIFIIASLIPSATINELTGLRAAVVKVNTELIARDVLLAEKKFLEKALADDFAQLENGKNQIVRELGQGHNSNTHGLVDEVNRTIPNSIKYKQEAIKKINETLKKRN